MKQSVIILSILMPLVGFALQEKERCSDAPQWLKGSCRRLTQIMTEGADELYLPSYAWHNRYQYSSWRLHTYNENPWGGGLGKSFYDEKGDWHGLYAMAFLDSHKKVEPVAGYAFLKMHSLSEHLRAGMGFTVLATMRPDILHGIPFAGALPWVSINYRRVSLSGTYIPGTRNIGNVLFLVTKIIL
jgi:palmitoyl transferase